MKIAGLLLATAIAIHFYSFNQLPMQFDELLMFEILVRYRIWDIIPYLYIEEIQQPLGYAFEKLAMYFGTTTFVLRLPAFLFLILTPWALYKLARLSMNKEDSLKAGALFLFFFPVFMYSGSMRPYIAFVLFSILAFYNFLKPDRKQWFLVLSFLALFFIHPLGSVITLILTSILLMRRKEGINLFLSLIAFVVLLLTVAVLYRHQKISELLVQFSFAEYYRAVYNFSFLISGREFFFFVVTLLLAVAFKRYKDRTVTFKLDKIWIHAFGWSILGSLLLMLFFGKHIYPRHFMFLLPGLSIIVVSLINIVTTKLWLRHSLLVLGALILTYKSIGKEQLPVRPFEIDSAGMAQKALVLSEEYYPIVSCGNCFKYYIDSESHLCTGSALPTKYFDGFADAIYIEMNYVKPSCGLDKITEKFEIVESYDFIGGKVHKLHFPEN